MQPTKSQAIKRFLMASTHSDLAEKYHLGMEVQVNVGEDGGERIEKDYRGKQYHGYSDGITTWKNIRIPFNADTEPEFEDSPMTYDLAQHVEAIGLTGWNWQERMSYWVGFDFDAISGHSDIHRAKLSDRELGLVQTAATQIPWVTVRKSTSGNGLHLYVELEGFPTANHTEHAAAARSILGMMSAKVGFDFNAKVDACGAILWIWHRKMKGTQGLTLIKQGEKLSTVPDNWRDHIKVIKRSRTKTLPAFIENSQVPDIETLFEDITGQRANIQLDETHRKLIDWLSENGKHAWWDQDRWMLVAHTADLKEAHTELELRGVFETITRRSSPQNCYLFPMRKGAWSVRRFSPGVAEHASWSQDGAGWTTCYYNRDPDLGSASKSSEGLEHKSGGYVFQHAENAVRAAQLVGVDVNLPAWALRRPAKLKENKDGRLIMEIEQEKHDAQSGGLPGWIPEGKTWSKVFNANLRQPSEIEVANYDDLIRHVVSESGEDCGWAVKTGDKWYSEPLAHVKPALQGAMGLTPKEVTAVIGSSVFRHWKLVSRPFEPEYPGDRQWNRGAAQFAFYPTESRENLQYPTWMSILKHCGAGLDDAIKKHGWCKANQILTGADYLKVWVASLFQKPFAPLPYLFLYSQEQNTGKSIFHEALSELVTHGVARADNALTNQAGFNGELANAVLAVIEEVDLSKSKVAYNRIKDWTTSRTFQVHSKGETPYSVVNTLHFIQTANSHQFCPVIPGDTRITMIYVSPLSPSELIPKARLIDMLRKEASDFMAEILNLEIPASNDRLNIPVITTGEKITAQAANQSRLDAFIEERCHHVTGRMIKLSEFYEEFQAWLDPNDSMEWTKQKISSCMPPQYPKGRRRNDGQFHFGNISFEPIAPNERILPKLILEGEYLVEVSS